MTANITFVRIAAEQGIEFSVFVHPARALTEQKALEHPPKLNNNNSQSSKEKVNSDMNGNPSPEQPPQDSIVPQSASPSSSSNFSDTTSTEAQQKDS